MFDFILKINPKNSVNPYTDNNYFENKDNKTINCKSEWFQLYGQSFNNKDSFLIRNNYIIWIYGNIFLREGYTGNKDNGLLIENVLSDLNANYNIHSKYKGNYCVFFLNTNTKSLKIINSQLGLSHVYYYQDSNMFYAGNNLNHFKSLNLDYNICSIYQKLLFSYIISDDTFFEGVKRVKAGEIIELKELNVTHSIGYNLNNLFERTNYEKFNIDKYTYLFNKSVNERAACDENINVSFTGGFDGRTIISSLLNQGIKVNAYSFGKYNGENTRIPLRISKQTGINYKPIYLEDDYEKNYVEDAKKAIYFSDGISFNERANYIYAFRILSQKSKYVLSGLIGGETLRPVHLRTDYLNENYYQLCYLNNTSLRDECLSRDYMQRLLNCYDDNSINELRELIDERQSELISFRKTEHGFLYYMYDLMNTGFRMYYGTEIHLERQYCDNLTPYYDIDLLEYLFSTDYVRIFKQAFKKGKIHRWSGQKIYANIIQKNYKELNNYSVDRGYPPSYLLNPIKLLIVPYLYYRKKNREKFIDFDEQKWSRLFLKDFLNNNYEDNLAFDNKVLKAKVQNNLKNNIHSSEFNRLLSLHTWFNQ